MEKKYYQIVAKTPKDWKVVHELLMQDGSLEDNIPSSTIECVNEIKHSKTRSTYLMTADEAELLRQSDRILFVDLDASYHPEVKPPNQVCIKRFNKPVKNYRSLVTRDPANPATTGRYVIPNYSYNPIYTNPPETNRTGYQILRCTTETNPFSSDPSQVKYQDIDYNLDGSDVDCIVCDDGVFYGHPEFCYNEFSPPNYVRGNVLSRHGLCGVLDLVLDSPYYLDPDWFNADPSNRLEKRWDGTTVPKEQVAKDWWSGPQYRSQSFPNFGSINITHTLYDFYGNPYSSIYTRETACGVDQKRTSRNGSDGSPVNGNHGTPCSSLVYGQNYGWAFNANKWSMCINVGQEGSTVSDETAFNIQKIFHKYKPINPKFGTRNPTVSSNSWGARGEVPLFLVRDYGLYSYRNGNLTQFSVTAGDQPNFLRNSQYKNAPTNYVSAAKITTFYNDNNSDVIAGKELINEGVIFVVAAGNDGRYLGSPQDEDFNNYIVKDIGNGVPSTNANDKHYTNRPGYPSQIGYNTGQLERYKTFVIGAIDDEYTGRFVDSPGESDPYYVNESPGKETLARVQWRTLSNKPPSDYSNKGSGIDFYAPADGTIAANNYTSLSSDLFPHPYQIAGTVYNDESFGGTSAATPVSAGLIACFVQNNRDLNSVDLKTYLRNNITSQNSSNFFIGPRPGNDPWDLAWLVPYSVMGRAVKIIKEVTSRNATPNITFTPTYGIVSSSGANERFTISQNSSLTHKIEILGIKKFDETPTTYELNIKTGYYRVGSRSELSLQNLKGISLRVDPSNSKKLQLSDSDGNQGWDDMEITVFNGEFKQVSTEIYYVFSGGTLATNSAYSSSSASGPTYTPTAGDGKITGGGDLIVTGDIIAGDDIIGLVSDERLKENIKLIENALDKTQNLEGFTYNFNELGEKLGFDPNKRHSGVSAQKVQDILPEASAPAPKDNNYLTVKYDKLIPLLIEAVKDLKNDIDTLKDNNNK